MSTYLTRPPTLADELRSRHKILPFIIADIVLKTVTQVDRPNYPFAPPLEEFWWQRYNPLASDLTEDWRAEVMERPEFWLKLIMRRFAKWTSLGGRLPGAEEVMQISLLWTR